MLLLEPFINEASEPRAFQLKLNYTDYYRILHRILLLEPICYLQFSLLIFSQLILLS